MVHPRFAKNFAFHPPWGDCREIGLIHPGDPQESPPPPADADKSSLRAPESYPDELANRRKNAEKRAKKAKKEQVLEEKNHRLIKSDVEKKKAEGKAEHRSKLKHDPSSAALKKKSAPKRRLAKPVGWNDESESSDQDDPPLTREEVDATLFEQVNITTSTILFDLRASAVPIAPPKKICLKRKTPRTIVTMVDHVDTSPDPEVINIQDLVVDAPISTTKPGEQIPKTKVKKITTPSAE